MSVIRSALNISKNLLKSKNGLVQIYCLQAKNNFSISALLKSNAGGRKFTEKHEWISVNGDVGTVGITDYAQDKLGEVVYLELPQKGAKLNKGDAFATLESVKAVSECYSPVSGEVVETNEPLVETPNLVNKSPNQDGWLVRVKIANNTELNDLMDESQYLNFLKTSDH